MASPSLEFDRLQGPIAPDESPARPIREKPTLLTTDGQLALQLPSELPTISLEPEWKAQQRLWGHSFHPMCSYLASFPASLVHAFIARYTRPGDVVLDPFSGRGTTPLQACAEGRVGVGNDLNPFAHILTAAKVDPPDEGGHQDTRHGASPRLVRLGGRVERTRRRDRREPRLRGHHGPRRGQQAALLQRGDEQRRESRCRVRAAFRPRGNSGAARIARCPPK